MKRLTLFLVFLCLMLLLISGCGPKIITKTETVYLAPPETLTKANKPPEMPSVPDRELEVEDVVRWHDEREARWKRAWQESEADKRSIRNYLNTTEE